MVVVFAREITEDLTSLVKKIDATVADNKGKNMKAFVVLLADDADAAAKQLAEVAKKAGLKGTPLTIYDGATGPGNYKIAKDADVTVLMWRKRRVLANHAFPKGKLNEAAIKAVVADTSKILE